MNARNIGAACALLLTTLIITSCKDDRPTPRLPEPSPKESPAQAPDTPKESPTIPSLGEGVIAKGEEVEVRVEDFAEHARRAMLFAPDEALATKRQPDPRRMRTPYIHMNVTRALVAASLAESEARKRGIKISSEDIAAAIANDPNLRRFGAEAIVGMDGEPLGVTLSEVGLTPDDVEHAGRHLALRLALTPKLLEGVSTEDAWRAWSNAHDIVDLVVVTLPNVPTSTELDVFLSDPDNQPRILAHFEENKARFSDLPTVLLDILSTPRGESPDREKLLKAKRALDEGEAVDAIAARLGLNASTRDTFIAAEDRAAFVAPDGSTGVSFKAPRGSYAWRVVEHVTPPPATLDRQRRREVAAEILRTQELSPAGLEALGDARAVLRAAKGTPATIVSEVRKSLTSNRGARVLHTGPFTPNANQFVPKLGVHEPLSTFAFGSSLDQPISPLDPPLRGEQSLVVARVLRRERPSREVFDADSEAHLAEFREKLEPKIIDLKMNEWFDAHGVQLDLRPLRERYGIDKKPGAVPQGVTIQKVPPKKP